MWAQISIFPISPNFTHSTARRDPGLPAKTGVGLCCVLRSVVVLLAPLALLGSYVLYVVGPFLHLDDASDHGRDLDLSSLSVSTGEVPHKARKSSFGSLVRSRKRSSLREPLKLTPARAPQQRGCKASAGRPSLILGS